MALELHFHGDVLSPRLDRGGNDEDEIETFDDPSPVEESTDAPASGKGALGAVVALVVLVLIGVAVRKFRNGDDSLDD